VQHAAPLQEPVFGRTPVWANLEQPIRNMILSEALKGLTHQPADLSRSQYCTFPYFPVDYQSVAIATCVL